MAHYRDGTEAKVGDRARGPCRSTGLVEQGVLVSIDPGTDACNCQLVYPVLVLHPGAAVPVVILTAGYCDLHELEKVE